MAAVTICSDFGVQKKKSDIVSTVSPSISNEVMGSDAMILVFWMLSFKPTFSLSSFTFIKMLFSSSSLSAIRVVSSAYLRWLIFLPAILIPTCASSSPAFLMMYSAYKLNKQGDNLQPWCTPFPICVNIWYFFFSFWLTTLCVTGSCLIHLTRIDSNSYFLWLLFHCIHIPQFLYPFICQWISVSMS